MNRKDQKAILQRNWQPNSCLDVRGDDLVMKATLSRVAQPEFAAMKIVTTQMLALIAGCSIVIALVFAATPALTQTAPTYQPKFAGDPARSDSEAAALAYMRVVLRAQHRFEKQYG